MSAPATFAPPLSPEDMAVLRYRQLGPLSYLQGNPSVSPGSASLGQGFQPDDSPDSGAWLYGGPPDPAAFKPQISASGASGSGITHQPEAPPPGDSSSGAAKTLGDRMPPPPLPSPMEGSESESSPSPVPQGPPSLPQTGGPPSGASVQAPQGAPGASPSPTLDPPSEVKRIQAEQQKNDLSKPVLHTHWAQRLALAVLSATKLAPYANQIVHPKYTDQMEAYENTAHHLTQELGNAEKAENIAGLNEQRHQHAQYYSDEAETHRLKIEADHDAKMRMENLRQTSELQKQDDLQLKGRDAHPLKPGELPPEGWDLINSVVDPSVRYAASPRVVRLPSELVPHAPGRVAGQPVSAEEFKRIQEAQQKWYAQQTKPEAAHQPNPEQQFIAEFQVKNPKASVAEAQRAYALNQHVPPEQPPLRALMFGPDGRAIEVRPGMTVPQGAQTASGVNQASTPTAATRTRGEQGTIITQAGDNLIQHIQNNRDVLGNLGSYWDQFVNDKPIADPRASFMMSQLASFAALQPALHGFRSHDALKEFAKIIGGIPKNPDALISAIQGIQETAGIVSNVGRGQGKSSGPSPAASPSVAPIVQHSPSTGAYRYSLDGGKSWLPGQPPK